MQELSVIKAHGNFVSQQIEQLSQTVLVNADDGVELTLLDIEQVEAVDKTIESMQSLTRACLYWMRQKKGWLLLGFESFEDYGKQRFGYEKAHLHRIASAYEVEKTLSIPGDTQIPEKHLRPLAQVPESERQAIWDEANRKAEEAGKERTAKMIEEAVKEWKQKAEQAEQEADELAGTLERTEQEIERLKAGEQEKFESMTQALRLKLKQSEEMTKAVSEQRDRIQKSMDVEIKHLKARCQELKGQAESAQSAYAEVQQQAQSQQKEEELAQKSEDLRRIEQQMLAAESRVGVLQAEIDRLESEQRLSKKSEEAVQRVYQLMLGISNELDGFDLELEESDEDLSDRKINDWRRVIEQYHKGEARLHALLSKLAPMRLVG